MSNKLLAETICLKKYISEKEYKEVRQLKELCCSHDQTNLKLEIDYKLDISKNSKEDLNQFNEFLYYANDTLVGYLGICSFGANIGEINGMTHPSYRRKGIFKKLLELALIESRKRNFSKILLLSDNSSISGNEFIKAMGGKYDFSEYRMKQTGEFSLGESKAVNLRKAEKADGKEIARQNAIYFDDVEEIESYEEKVDIYKNTYMIVMDKSTIGKIRLEFEEKSAFISGFGILPDFRGKGNGKAALTEAIRLINNKGIYKIELDVVCQNSTALNLYKSCGFKEESVMNYYEIL